MDVQIQPVSKLGELSISASVNERKPRACFLRIPWNLSTPLWGNVFIQAAALEVFFRLNVEETELKYARPMFVSSRGLHAPRRLIRFGGNFKGREKSLGHKLDFISSVALQSGNKSGKINNSRHYEISAFTKANFQENFYTPSMWYSCQKKVRPKIRSSRPPLWSRLPPKNSCDVTYAYHV